METVLDALKAMKKATYREVAARLDIEPVEALNMLREQKEQGLCDFYDGSWSLGTVKQKTKAPARQVPRLQGDVPDPVDPDSICQLLSENGAQTTTALAAAVNRNARGMVAVMLAFERQGVVVKNGQGKGVTWSLPDLSKSSGITETPVINSDTKGVGMDSLNPIKVTVVESAPQDLICEAVPDSEKTTAEVIESIPAFASRPDDLLIPSSRFISSEIRRTKAKLTNLQKLQSAVRELRRHKNLLVGLRND
jgi:hypothetical protein